MFKRIILGALTTVLLSTGAALVEAAPAQADHNAGPGDQRPCVSRHEFQNIRWQWPPATKARVTDHFDLYGFLIDGWGTYYHRDAIWGYRKCPEWGYGVVRVWFDNYTWGDYRPTHRVYAISPSRHGHWISVQ